MPNKVINSQIPLDFGQCTKEQLIEKLVEAHALLGNPRRPRSKAEQDAIETTEPMLRKVRFELTEDMGNTMSMQATARIVNHTATPLSPTEAIVVYDPMNMYSSTISGDFGQAERFFVNGTYRWEVTEMAPGSGGGGEGGTYTAGCGLNVSANQFSVDPGDLAGGGLVAAGSGCYLEIDPGCGLELSSAETTAVLQVKYGTGLDCIDGELVCTVVNTDTIYSAGCGLTLSEEEAFSVDNTALAGGGLAAVDASCKLTIDYGCGLELSSLEDDALLQVKYGTGLDCTGGELICTVVNTDELVKITSGGVARYLLAQFADVVMVNHRTNTCDFIVQVYNNADSLVLYVDGPGRVKVADDNEALRYLKDVFQPVEAIKPSSGIVDIDFHIPTSAAVDCSTGPQIGAFLNLEDIPLGCGLAWDGTDFSVAVGGCLDCTGGAVSLTAGCGLTCSGGEMSVDASDLAGTGLYTSGTCTLNADVYATYVDGEYNFTIDPPEGPGPITITDVEKVTVRSITDLDCEIDANGDLKITLTYEDFEVLGTSLGGATMTCTVTGEEDCGG